MRKQRQATLLAKATVTTTDGEIRTTRFRYFDDRSTLNPRKAELLVSSMYQVFVWDIYF